MVTAGANQAFTNVVLALLDAEDRAALFRRVHFFYCFNFFYFFFFLNFIVSNQFRLTKHSQTNGSNPNPEPWGRGALPSASQGNPGDP